MKNGFFISSDLKTSLRSRKSPGRRGYRTQYIPPLGNYTRSCSPVTLFRTPKMDDALIRNIGIQAIISSSLTLVSKSELIFRNNDISRDISKYQMWRWLMLMMVMPMASSWKVASGLSEIVMQGLAPASSSSPVCLSVCLSVCLVFHPFLSVCLYVCLSVCMSVS